MSHGTSANHSGLVMGVRVDRACGTAERDGTLAMLDHLERRHGMRPTTLGAGKRYEAGPFLVELEKKWIEPHMATKTRWEDRSAGRSGR